MKVRVVLALPLCCGLLCHCGVVRSVAALGGKHDEKPPVPSPARRGWGLMMSDKELAELGYPGAGATGSQASADATQGAASADAGGGIFDFSSMVQSRMQGSAHLAWQRSLVESTRQSRVTGRPLLTFITHQSSMPAQQMEKSLMSSPEFAAQVQESCVLLRVDFADQETARSETYQALKKRLRASGYPVVVLTLPDGTEVMRLTGYKPDYARRYLDTVRDGIQRSGKLAAERRTKLEREGYRLWTSKDGKPVFARLTALDANMGTFTGEWGETFKTFLTRLSEQDQAWIAQRRQPAA